MTPQRGREAWFKTVAEQVVDEVVIAGAAAKAGALNSGSRAGP